MDAAKVSSAQPKSLFATNADRVFFVLGASGTIGRGVVRALLKRQGCRVIGLARSEQASATIQKLGAEAVCGDILFLNDWSDEALAALAASDVVIHCASEPCGNDAARLREFLTEKWLEPAAAENEGKTLVYTGSVWSLGQGRHDDTQVLALPPPLPGLEWMDPETDEMRQVLALPAPHRGIVVHPPLVWEWPAGAPGCPESGIFSMVTTRRWGLLPPEERFSTKLALPPERILGDVHADDLGEVFALVIDDVDAPRGVSYTAATGSSTTFGEYARAAAVAVLGQEAAMQLPEASAEPYGGRGYSLPRGLREMDVESISSRAQSLGWQPKHFLPE